MEQTHEKKDAEKKEDIPLLKFHTDEAQKDLGDGQVLSTKRQFPRLSSADISNPVLHQLWIPWDLEAPLLVFLSEEESDYSTPFLNAVYDGDLKTLQTVHFSPGSLEAEEGLHIACIKGHNDIVEYLLTKNINIYHKNSRFNMDALSLATYFDHGAVVKRLLESGRFTHLPQVELDEFPLSLIHLASFYGCLSTLEAFVQNKYIKIDVDERDKDDWRPIHYAISQGHTNIVRFLLGHHANPDAEGPFRVRPLHVAAYRGFHDIIELLLDHNADPRKIVSLNFPKYPSSVLPKSSDYQRWKMFPSVVSFNAKKYSTLLHWAVDQGSLNLVKKMIDCGSSVNSHNIEGITPLGLSLTAGRKDIIYYFMERGIHLSDEDKNWRRIADEESGINVLDILKETNLDTLDCSNKEGFSLLHLAASKGFLTLMNRLLNREVNPNLESVRGETALFFSVKYNHQACMQRLIKSGANASHIDKQSSSILHTAAKHNNFFAVDAFLKMIYEGENLDINLADEDGFTAIYYAISAGRYDIVQRFVLFCVCQSIHVRATKTETLLQFYTERNILGQYDNSIVRVLELEKALHSSKTNAEKCVRMQLGTTEASTKAREQLQAMYESTKVQLHCWNFWIVITCFLLPSILFFLDVYTDVVLAVEYYNDYYDNSTSPIIFNITESQSKINFFLTVFFILFPMILLNTWNLYIHVTQQDVHPLFRRMNTIQRGFMYTFIFILPVGPVVTYIENCYAQIKYMVTSSEISEERLEEEEKSVSHHMRERLRKHYNMKHVSQMRVAINNVLEATLESAFQLVLQLYILGTQYSKLKALHLGELTIGSIFSLAPTEDSKSRLSKQALSVLISLISLVWSFTAYHRFNKLGGLKLLWSLPLLFAIFFQVISRAIACTVFTLAYTWKIVIVLFIHCVIVILMKMKYEKRSAGPKSMFLRCCPCLDFLRSYFYVFLGAFTSTFVYFRIQRPHAGKDELSQRHSTFTIQILFLLLALIENVLLFGIGAAHLDPDDHDSIFQIVSGVICLISFIVGVSLQLVYYGCFGHPWVDINGPTVERDEEGSLQFAFHTGGGQSLWTIRSCTDCDNTYEKDEDHVYRPSKLGRNSSIVDGKVIIKNGSKIR